MSSFDDSPTEAIRIISEDSHHIQIDALDYFVASGPDSGKRGTLSLPLIRIGSAEDNDVILTDRTVSRHHAEIRLTSEGPLLRDLGSTNGTLVGSLRVTEVFLSDDTLCLLGHTRIRFQQRVEKHRLKIEHDHQLGLLVGASRPMRELYGYIRTIAPTPTTVLIQGESGCGKELVARTLHELSGRKGPLVVFDASVTDPEMVRNDLFGHVKGAFTGAAGSREGAFRHAHGGTLFIDEIGELSLDLQPRLLRALENREVTPIGSDTPVRVDVRVVTASHRDLTTMVKQGAFRADLYYRLSVVPLKVPPLRAIREDIPLLVDNFIERLELKCRIDPQALVLLQQYHWPGNVRELRNVIERAAILCQDDMIQPRDLHLPDGIDPASVMSVSMDSLDADALGVQSRTDLRAVERQMILDTLTRNSNNKTAAARELDMPLSTLKRRLKEYGIE